MTSSSVASTNIRADSSPETNFSARPCIYSALRCERPAVRSVAISFSTTWAGVGKCFELSPVLGGRMKRELNLFLMEEAAAPETFGMIVSHAFLSSWRVAEGIPVVP